MEYKVAMPFRLNDPRIEEYTELNVIFEKGKNNPTKFVEFLGQYENHRINIEFTNGIDYSLVDIANKISDKIYIRLTLQDITRITVDKLKEHNCKFFCDSIFPAYNYTTLKSYLSLGVSDVYIADDLCYSLDNVKKICANNDVQIRLILNRIPSTSFTKGISYETPIYRPQDIDRLTPYYDVFELDCGRPYDWARADVLYRVWFQEKHWNGEISEINPDLCIPFHDNSIIPDFTEYKLNCGFRCGSRPNPICQKCEQFIHIGELLKKKSFAFEGKKA